MNIQQSPADVFPQISTPTDLPSTGYNYLYFKSDGNLYKMDSSGVETMMAFVPPDEYCRITTNGYTRKAGA